MPQRMIPGSAIGFTAWLAFEQSRCRPVPLLRDELTLQGKLIFKGQQLVVPISLRKKLMAATHASHIGGEACIRRARDSLYWPRMTTGLNEYIAICEVCMAHRREQSKEPIQQHDFAARPWSKVAVDLCDLDWRTLLVI